ncbi:MaoC family dehydratase [Xanthobacter sp. DSM 24535]|uniref:MaoC family dehydratase n=1 Tax=Roseixanthobacter psychrophilus TaxID=3119917 RepID=UPI003728C3DF
MNFFDEIQVGDREILGTHTFTRDEIVAFARKFDPQPFHVDDEAAKRSLFGALCASGWHTAANWMKYFVAYQQRTAAERVSKGIPVPVTGPSPGFKDLRWLKPVYAGDVITYATEAREKILPKSRPDWGMLIAYNTGTNQDGVLVFDFESRVFVQRHP